MLTSVPNASQRVFLPPSRGSLGCTVRRRGAVNPMLPHFRLCTTPSCQCIPRDLPETISSQPLTHTAFVPPTSYTHPPTKTNYPVNTHPPTPQSPIKTIQTPHQALPSTTHKPRFSPQLTSTQLGRTHLISTKRNFTIAHNVHPPHLPLAPLPPPTLHRHRYLLVRRSAPGSDPF
jgi:hypothetical protein